MPHAGVDRHSAIAFEPYSPGHLLYMAHFVFLPDGTRPDEAYAEKMAETEAYTMLESGCPIACFGCASHGNSLGEAWAILTTRARQFPLALTRGVSRRILPTQQKLGLSLIFSKVRKEKPKWNWWIQALRVRMPDGSMKSFEIKDILKQDDREYLFYVMNF